MLFCFRVEIRTTYVWLLGVLKRCFTLLVHEGQTYEYHELASLY